VYIAANKAKFGIGDYMDKTFNEVSIRNKRKTIMYYLTQKEKNEVIKECGITAMVLYEYFISKALSKIDLSSDDTTAKSLAISQRTITRNRLTLTKHNYYYRVKISGKTDAVVINYIGKEAVLKEKFFESLFGKDIDSVNKVKKKFTYTQINKIIEDANLSIQDTTDLINLFGSYEK